MRAGAQGLYSDVTATRPRSGEERPQGSTRGCSKERPANTDCGCLQFPSFTPRPDIVTLPKLLSCELAGDPGPQGQFWANLHMLHFSECPPCSLRPPWMAPPWVTDNGTFLRATLFCCFPRGSHTRAGHFLASFHHATSDTFPPLHTAAFRRSEREAGRQGS